MLCSIWGVKFMFFGKLLYSTITYKKYRVQTNGVLLLAGGQNLKKNRPSQYVDFTHLACSRPIFDSIFELYAPFYLLEKVFEHFFALF